MFRRATAAAVGAALFLLATVPTGAIYVTSLPSGADVWVDGTYIGHSPLVIDALAAGRHALSLTKTGWAPQDVDIAVVAGGTALSSVQLQRANARGVRLDGGLLAVKGIPAHDMTIDGTKLVPDKQQVYVVSSGMHRIVAETPAGKMTRDVMVYPDMRTDVVLHDDSDVRSVVVAPVSDYLPANAVKIDGTNVVIHFGGHDVVARMGSASYRVDGQVMSFDSAPTLIGSKLYLPLDLLTKLTASAPKAK